MEAEQYRYLNTVNSPEELKKLTTGELVVYCEELRRFIIQTLAHNPGHLASSLGALELTVALHYVYDAPQDKIVWDVGHQAYAHKIITGRRDAFHTLRRSGGIAGFPRPSESPFDAFIAGHASNSISAALGFAIANRLTGNPHHVVAVIGDGAMSGGLAFEGLNNAGVSKSDLLVILNDNRISIDKGAGALREYLVGITTSRRYNRFKTRLWNRFQPGSRVHNFLKKTANAIKHGLLQQSNLFESFGFRYFGPVDGHDVVSLVKVLRDLREIGGPKLLHTLTVKGHGYAPAERDPTHWHAPGKFELQNEEPGAPSAPTPPSSPITPPSSRWSDVFGAALLDLALADERIVAVTPAMGSGSGLGAMIAAMPGRVFDVGIAEGHAVTFAAGLAAAGLVPFCVVYSSFLQRAWDNVIHDVAIEGLGVVLCIDRGGLVGEDGTTHQGVFDIAGLLPIPGVVVSSPMDASELRSLMLLASRSECPFVIRYPRGAVESVPGSVGDGASIEIGRGRRLRDVSPSPDERESTALLSFGPVGVAAARAAEMASERGRTVAHYDLRFAKPLDETLLHEVGQRFSHIVTIEDGSVCGGVGSAVEEFPHRHSYPVRVTKLGVPDSFIAHAPLAEQHALCGLDADSILAAISS